MYPIMAQHLIELLRPHLPDHPQGVPPHMQVLATLRFLGCGDYQKAIGQDLNHPMSQTTVSSYLHRVVPVNNALADDFIYFPSSPAERRAVQQR